MNVKDIYALADVQRPNIRRRQNNVFKLSRFIAIAKRLEFLQFDLENDGQEQQWFGCSSTAVSLFATYYGNNHKSNSTAGVV